MRLLHRQPERRSAADAVAINVSGRFARRVDIMDMEALAGVRYDALEPAAAVKRHQPSGNPGLLENLHPGVLVRVAAHAVGRA